MGLSELHDQDVESQFVVLRYLTPQATHAIMNDTEVSEFSYLTSITYTAPLNEMANRNAKEQEIYEAAINSRFAAILQIDINFEVTRL